MKTPYSDGTEPQKKSRRRNERQRVVQLDAKTLAKTRIWRVNAKPSTSPSICYCPGVDPFARSPSETGFRKSTASSASSKPATFGADPLHFETGESSTRQQSRKPPGAVRLDQTVLGKANSRQRESSLRARRFAVEETCSSVFSFSHTPPTSARGRLGLLKRYSRCCPLCFFLRLPSVVPFNYSSTQITHI